MLSMLTTATRTPSGPAAPVSAPGGTAQPGASRSAAAAGTKRAVAGASVPKVRNPERGRLDQGAYADFPTTNVIATGRPPNPSNQSSG